MAIKEKDKAKLQKSVKEFKDAKLADTEGDLAKAESILKRFKAKDGKKVSLGALAQRSGTFKRVWNAKGKIAVFLKHLKI